MPRPLLIAALRLRWYPYLIPLIGRVTWVQTPRALTVWVADPPVMHFVIEISPTRLADAQARTRRDLQARGFPAHQIPDDLVAYETAYRLLRVHGYLP